MRHVPARRGAGEGRGTGNVSQRWYIFRESTGKSSLRPAANTTLALNANRSAIGTTANVLTAATNNPQDYQFASRLHVGSFKLSLYARYAHTNTVYLTSHGAKTMCTWQYYNANTDWQAY